MKGEALIWKRLSLTSFALGAFDFDSTLSLSLSLLLNCFQFEVFHLHQFLWATCQAWSLLRIVVLSFHHRFYIFYSCRTSDSWIYWICTKLPPTQYDSVAEHPVLSWEPDMLSRHQRTLRERIWFLATRGVVLLVIGAERTTTWQSCWRMWICSLHHGWLLLSDSLFIVLLFNTSIWSHWTSEMPLARVIEVNVSEGEHICAALCADTDHSIHALPGASEDSVPDMSENRCPDCAMQCTEFQRCNPRPRCKRYPELMVVEAPVYPALSSYIQLLLYGLPWLAINGHWLQLWLPILFRQGNYSRCSWLHSLSTRDVGDLCASQADQHLICRKSDHSDVTFKYDIQMWFKTCIQSSSTCLDFTSRHHHTHDIIT